MPSTEWLQKHQSSSKNIRKKRKGCLLHTRYLAQQVPSAGLGWGHPDLLHLGPRCPRSGTQHSQPRQAELSPKKGVHGTTPRHINIMILHLSWEILLSVPVGHSVGSGTFEVCADHRCQHATLGSSFVSTPSHRLSR